MGRVWPADKLHVASKLWEPSLYKVEFDCTCTLLPIGCHGFQQWAESEVYSSRHAPWKILIITYQGSFPDPRHLTPSHPTNKTRSLRAQSSLPRQPAQPASSVLPARPASPLQPSEQVAVEHAQPEASLKSSSELFEKFFRTF